MDQTCVRFLQKATEKNLFSIIKVQRRLSFNQSDCESCKKLKGQPFLSLSRLSHTISMFENILILESYKMPASQIP
jgi:hypothetical protein